MSYMTLQSIETISRGLSMRLSFTISCNKHFESNEETQKYYIGDEFVEFYCEFTQCKNEDTITPAVTARKLCMKRSSFFIINVKSVMPKFSQTSVCGYGWMEYTLKPIPKSSCIKNILFYKFDIIVTVIEEKKGTLYAQVNEDKDFTDFNLIGVNGNVAVHKVVLAASSNVFKTMLLGKWKETTEGNIDLAGTTQTTLQHLKDFMYLGILPNNELNSLLLLAKCYMMDDLKTKCIEKIANSITPENLYTNIEFACENNLPELTFEILHFTSLHPDIADKAYKIKTATSPQECSSGCIETVKNSLAVRE